MSSFYDFGEAGYHFDDSYEDSLMDQAISICKETGSVSASELQKRLGIGYPRAARLVEAIEGTLDGTDTSVRIRYAIDVDPGINGIPLSLADNETIARELIRRNRFITACDNTAFFKEDSDETSVSSLYTIMLHRGDMYFVLDADGNIEIRIDGKGNIGTISIDSLRNISNYSRYLGAVYNLIRHVRITKALNRLLDLAHELIGNSSIKDYKKLEISYERIKRSQVLRDEMIRTDYILDAVDNALKVSVGQKRIFLAEMRAFCRFMNRQNQNADVHAMACTHSALVALYFFSECVHIQYYGYVLLGEHDAAKQCQEELIKALRSSKIDKEEEQAYMKDLIMVEEKAGNLSLICESIKDLENAIFE